MPRYAPTNKSEDDELDHTLSDQEICDLSQEMSQKLHATDSGSFEQLLKDLNVLLFQAFESVDLDNAFVPSEQFEFLEASGDVVPGTRIETLRFTGELGQLQQSIL